MYGFYTAANIHVLCLKNASASQKATTDFTRILKQNASFNRNSLFDYNYYSLLFDKSFNDLGTLGKPVSMSYDYDTSGDLLYSILINIAICLVAGIGTFEMALQAFSTRSIVRLNSHVNRVRRIARAYSLPPSLSKALEDYVNHVDQTTNSIYSATEPWLLNVVPNCLKTSESVREKIVSLDFGDFTLAVPELEKICLEVSVSSCGHATL